jgi:hypothetical protein
MSLADTLVGRLDRLATWLMRAMAGRNGTVPIWDAKAETCRGIKGDGEPCDKKASEYVDGLPYCGTHARGAGVALQTRQRYAEHQYTGFVAEAMGKSTAELAMELDRLRELPQTAAWEGRTWASQTTITQHIKAIRDVLASRTASTPVPTPS